VWMYGGGNASADRGKPRAAKGSEAMDIEKLTSALEGFKDIPSEKFGEGITVYLKEGSKLKDVVERIDSGTKAAATITTVNGGNFPTGLKPLPYDEAYKPPSVYDTVQLPDSHGLHWDAQGRIIGWDVSYTITIKADDKSKPDTIRTSKYKTPKK